jgi:ankyrin repeat protein
MSAIHQAVRIGDLRELGRLLDAGADIETYNEAGETPLMTACLSAEAPVELVRLLLDRGADPNALARPLSAAPSGDTELDPLTALREFPDMEEMFGDNPEILDLIHGMEDQLRAGNADTESERSSVLSLAVNPASLEKLRLLLERGADPNYRSAAGYTPVIHAACAGRMDVIEWLLSAGASPDGSTSYGESALSVLSRSGEFSHVARLLEMGADPAPLKWTPLHRAAALGSPDEISALLDRGEDHESGDFWERTPLLLAIHAGKIENASLLLERGANRAATGRCGRTAMHYPPDRDDAPMLRWLLDREFPAGGMDDFKGTPLMHAVECGALACFEALIDEGVEWRRTDKFGDPLIANANHPEIIRRLIELGQSAEGLEDEVLRDWIGLGTRDGLPVTEAEFHAGRSRRFGTANPERMDVPFWNAMVRNGWNAWQAAKPFGHESFGLDDPVWCHDRFGMSLTPLPDGRWVQIAGEHEDHYDPDFCIYNDVIVHDGQGGFEIFGYPEEVFPPTDFHSATLVGEWIYIIGNLGYPETREAFGYGTPVFRLHTGDWHIERVETRGESPGWIHKHQAQIEGDRIRVFQGSRYFLTDDGEGKIRGLEGSYSLELASGTWRWV